MLSKENFDKLKAFPVFRGKVVTGSMIPVINIGEEIVVKIGEQNLKRFDIIVIYMNERLVCHFLWQKNTLVKPLLYQTRNMSGGKDYPVTEDEYLGKVISHRLSWWQKAKFLWRFG